MIDNGNTYTFVDQNMEDKLNLKNKKIVKHYKIDWFKSIGEVPATSRCLIKFSIGILHRDEIRCNVMRLEVCHQLLERSYQFNRKTQHDGNKMA